MSFASLRLRLVIPLGALAAACGGGGPSIDEIGSEAESAFCDRLVRCGSYPDQATCEESSFLAEDGDLAELKAAAERGTVVYDADAAQECLDAIAGGGCRFSDIVNDAAEEACNGVFTGTVADGGACLLDEECVSGQCDADPGCTMACCMGTCATTEPEPTPVPVGGDCSQDDCVDEAYCDETPATSTCVARAGEGGACTTFDGCRQGLYCDMDFVTGSGTCKAPPDTGEPCNPEGFSVCDRVDDYCDPTTAVCTRRVEVGGSCASGARCVEYAYCDAASTCQARPSLGEACDVDGPRDCLGDLECVANVCAAPAPDTVCL